MRTTDLRGTKFGLFSLHECCSIIPYRSVVQSPHFFQLSLDPRKGWDPLRGLQAICGQQTKSTFHHANSFRLSLLPPPHSLAASLSKGSLLLFSLFSSVTQPMKFHQIHNFWLSQPPHLKEHQDFKDNTLKKTQHIPKQVIPMHSGEKKKNNKRNNCSPKKKFVWFCFQLLNLIISFCQLKESSFKHLIQHSNANASHTLYLGCLVSVSYASQSYSHSLAVLLSFQLGSAVFKNSPQNRT